MAEDDSQPLGRRPATQTSPLNMVVICRVCEHAIWQAVVDHMRVCVCSIYILLEKAKQSFAIKNPLSSAAEMFCTINTLLRNLENDGPH